MRLTTVRIIHQIVSLVDEASIKLALGAIFGTLPAIEFQIARARPALSGLRSHYQRGSTSGEGADTHQLFDPQTAQRCDPADRHCSSEKLMG